ncbi:protein FAM50 homolog [Aplysia californica]|uniref:Protein FAM50 homolog n=1 Tax=Aplysia californica TaxID=6500 RepID=A0ABM0JIU8_APLCA|nr:protein FAM50 homolog [Aplysia californica]XP_005094664.1 protein FAM50 homolog [Aplysia californica]XP_035824703.1 protein FAM50 homolog [Aplysia californica]
MAHYKGAAKEAGRAATLLKKRALEQEEAEAKKKKIEEELAIGSIHNKFATHYDAIEQSLKSSTIGLVTLDEMKARQENVIKERERQLANKHAEARLIELAKEDKKKRDQRKITMLSFDLDEEEEENDDDDDEEKFSKPSKFAKPSKFPKKSSSPTDSTEADTDQKSDVKTEVPDDDEVAAEDEDMEEKFSPFERQETSEEAKERKRKKRLGMNPDVDTSFLPDRDRDEEENKLREKLRQDWVATQERIKNEEISITYSYWDGSGHRRNARMKKGNTVQQFLQKCLENLRKEFNDLRPVSVDQLMYVKEDLIIPHHYSFYDFIVTKARGKSGPLFSFDVHDDIRMINDAKVEKSESHAGKVCLRSWYERNKHIFPASRWEPYDPEKSWDNYTISDKNAVKITVK